MFESTNVRLRVFSPSLDNQISSNANATISDTAVEFRANDYDLTGDDYRITAAELDLRDSRVEYTVTAPYSGTFRGDPTTDFNGYELTYSELVNNSDMYIRDVWITGNNNSLGLTNSRVDFTKSKLFVNIAGLDFTTDDSFSVQLGFRIRGDSGRDTLTGGDGRDHISGGKGNDRLFGEGGYDKLVGGAGADKLNGGGGGDRFIFQNLSDSTVASSGRDTILDFRQEKDRIDLRPIDANEDRGGNQKFHFIGDDRYSKDAGELRYFERGESTYVQGDTDGDGRADFSIKLSGHHDLVAGDFLL